MAEDNALISRAKSGDEQAFTDLMRAYYGFVYRIVVEIVNNPHDAEEVVQDTFLNVYRGLAQYEERTKFRSWLAKIARNRALNWQREHRTNTVSINEVGEGALQYADSPDEQLIRDEQIELIRRAMGTLTQKDRDIARAYYLDGASYDELIRTHGLSYTAISFRLSRAKRTLAKRLQYLLNVAFVPPVISLKKNSLGGLTAMKIGTAPKITVGAIAIIALVFIGLHQLKSPEENLSLSERVVESMPNESIHSVAQTDNARKSTVVTSLSEDKPQISTEEMEQIEDFFAQLDAADVQSETDSPQIATDVEVKQNTAVGDTTESSSMSERATQSAEDVMNAYVAALKNLDSETMLSLITANFREESRNFWDLFDSNSDPELKEVLQWAFGQTEIVSSEHVGDEFHFRVRVTMPLRPLLEKLQLPEGILPPESLKLLEEIPGSIPLLHKMQKEKGAWRIYEF